VLLYRRVLCHVTDRQTVTGAVCHRPLAALLYRRVLCDGTDRQTDRQTVTGAVWETSRLVKTVYVNTHSCLTLLLRLLLTNYNVKLKYSS